MEDEQLKKLIALHKPKPRQHTETTLVSRLMKVASKFGARLYRNSTGTYHLPDGRYVSSGLCVGSSDLIGWTEVTMTAADVGKRYAVFTAVECKSATGRATGAQVDFICRVQAAGGIAQIVRSEQELEVVLSKGVNRG